jgi:hypothetical protein
LRDLDEQVRFKKEQEAQDRARIKAQDDKVIHILKLHHLNIFY